MTDPTPAAAAEAVRLDDRLQQRVARLVEIALDKAEEDLLAGTPTVRAKVWGTLLPSLLKALGDSERDEELDEIRAEQKRLFAAMQAQVAGQRVLEDDDAIPEDAPPPKPKRARRGS